MSAPSLSSAWSTLNQFSLNQWSVNQAYCTLTYAVHEARGHNNSCDLFTGCIAVVCWFSMLRPPPPPPTVVWRSVRDCVTLDLSYRYVQWLAETRVHVTQHPSALSTPTDILRSEAPQRKLHRLYCYGHLVVELKATSEKDTFHWGSCGWLQHSLS